MALIAHPVPNKAKSRIICDAFIAGAPKSASGHVFFGVNHGNVASYLRAKALGEDWWYIDNSYFDRHRGTYFRVAKNALQRTGTEPSDGSRFKRLGIQIKPWREHPGRFYLLCEQNENFMACAVGYKGRWVKNTLALIDSFKMDLPIKVRAWNANKPQQAIELMDMLHDIRAVVTHSSASALTALFEGVPALSEAGAAHAYTGPITRESLMDLPRPANREMLAHSLADGQFTLDEMRSGEAWAHLAAK